jgi:hypothetical protein
MMILPLYSSLLKGPTSLTFRVIQSVVGINSEPNEEINHHFLMWEYVTWSL